MFQTARYTLSHQKEDLDKVILQYTEVLLLPPISRGDSFLNVVESLFRLAITVLNRFEEFEQPDGIEHAVEYLRYIRRLSLDSFDVPRILVTTSLIRALRAQVRLGSGNSTQNIKEMVALCNELIFSNKSEDIPTTSFSCLGLAVTYADLNHEFPTEMLDEVVECLRDAVRVCSLAPASYEVMNALASTLGIRFRKTHSKGDYEEATVVLERILEPGGCPDSFRGAPLSHAISLADGRTGIFPDPEYSEVAISRLREASSSPFLSENLRFVVTACLANHASIRFREYGLNESLEESNTYVSQLVNTSSSLSLAESAELFSGSEEVREAYSVTDIQQKIEHLEHLLSVIPPETNRYIECLGHLEGWYESKFRRTDDISDLEEAIKYGRLSLDATRVGDPWRITTLGSLHDILLLAFQETGKIRYLDESIVIGCDILESKNGQRYHFPATRKLVASLLAREQLLGRIEDRLEAIRLMSLAMTRNDQYSRVSDRFRLSCHWAILARSIDHPTTLTAYKTAMSLIQKSISFAPTVSIQHTRLVAMGEDCQTMPLDYASYQIDLGRFEEAVETLEQGRASHPFSSSYHISNLASKFF